MAEPNTGLRDEEQDPSEIRNLVEELSEEERKKLAAAVLRDHVNDVDSRAGRMRRARKWQKLYSSDMDPKNFPFENCLSRDTEILTETRGWVLIADVPLDERVMTRVDETGELEWAPVEAKPRAYAERLYHFHSTSLDLMVTPDHEMVVRSQDGNVERMTAENLWNTTGYRVPLSGTWTRTRPAELFGRDPGDVAEFVGWYLAEGYQAGGSLGIAQSRTANPEKCARIEALLGRLGFTWAYERHAFTVHVRSMPSDLVELLRAQGHCDEKRVPTRFFACDSETIARLLEGLILGDGCHVVEPGKGDYEGKKYESEVYATTSKGLADDVQVLALLAGKRATIREREPAAGGTLTADGRKIVGKRLGYILRICKRAWAKADAAKKDEGAVVYDDIAYCVTVRNHSIYVRRNGRPSFVGNCANVNAPLLSYSHQQILSRLWDMLLPASGDICHARATGVKDVERSMATEKYFNSFLRYELTDYALSWYETMNQVCRAGSAFRRQYYDPTEKRIRVDWLSMENVVVQYSEKIVDPSMRGVPRYTIVLYMDDRKMSRYLDEKTFVAKDKEITPKDATGAESQKSEFARGADKIDGVSRSSSDAPEDKPRMVLEQYRWWKLPKRKSVPGFDGKYHAVIATVDEPTKQVLRLVVREEDDPKDKRRFMRQTQKRELWLAALAQRAQMAAAEEAGEPAGMPEGAEPMEPTMPPELPPEPAEPAPAEKREITFMTHIRGFASDGFYGTGLGDLIGPLNQALNTIINQLIDAMTIKNAGGGWYSSQLRMPTGAVSFTPGEYQRIEAPAVLMKDGIMHRTAPEASAVTMPVVAFLKEMGQQVTSTGDVLSGEKAAANETATTTSIRAEMAMKQISVLARLIVEAMKCELANLWRLLSLFMDEEEAQRIVNDDGSVEHYALSRADFVADADVSPSADPRVSSNAELVGRSQALLAAVSQNPLTMNNPAILHEATANHFEALGHRGLVQLLPPPMPQPPPPPPPKPQFEENAGFLNEQDSPVHPDDDDDGHLDEMGVFHADALGGQQLSPVGKKMYDRHARAHMAQRLMKHRSQDHAATQAPAGPPPGRPLQAVR